MTIFHPDDVGFFDQLLKCGHRNRKLVIVGVMVDDDIQCRKQVGDVVVEFDGILHVQRLVIRHAKKNTVGPEVTLGEMIFPANSDSGDHKHGVVRRIVGFEKFSYVLDSGCIQVVERSDQRMRALPVVVCEQRPTVDDGGGIRLIIEAQTPLGRVFVGIRENEQRMLAVGYPATQPNADTTTAVARTGTVAGGVSLRPSNITA